MRAGALVWKTQPALFAALCVLPAGFAVASDPSKGLALAFGVLPGAAVGIPPDRRKRIQIVLIGALIGLGMLGGAVLAEVPVVAVVALFLAAVGAALISRNGPLGTLVMVLVVPMVGAGLSFDGASEAAGLAVLLTIGSVITWLVSLCWPSSPAMRPQPAGPAMTREQLLDYGLRLGLAGAICATVGFAGNFEHEGWAAAACLLVMRPDTSLVRLRGAGRAIAVTCGALTATVVADLGPPDAVLGLLVVVDMALLAGTRASRWYVTGGFTTFIVISLVLSKSSTPSTQPLNDRVVETLIGVGVALLFGSIHLLRTTTADVTSDAV